tara:strand:- start:46 stop:576 length:531 start_codon:yes stop_codon:yes gene_type:complete
MEKFLKNKLAIISFLFIPLVNFWDPNWLAFLGVQPYWPLFWILPWAILHGSIDGLILGLFVGLILDSISLDSSFSQIPGLVLCGIWFGKLSISKNAMLAHCRYGLICSIASLLCGSLYLFQILIKNLSENSIYFYFPSIKNIFAQVFITGLLAPFFCSLLMNLFKRSKGNNKLFNF